MPRPHLGPFREHFEIILVSFWDAFATLVGPFCASSLCLLLLPPACASCLRLLLVPLAGASSLCLFLVPLACISCFCLLLVSLACASFFCRWLVYLACAAWLCLLLLLSASCFCFLRVPPACASQTCNYQLPLRLSSGIMFFDDFMMFFLCFSKRVYDDLLITLCWVMLISGWFYDDFMQICIMVL